MTYMPRLSLSTESSGNTTTTPLSGSATFTGTGEQNEYPDVMVSCQADQDGVLYFDFSVDGTNWTTFPSDGFRVEAGIHEFHTAVKGGRYFRVRLENGSAAQSSLRLTTYYGTFAKAPSSPLNQTLSNDADATVVRAVSDETDSMLGLYSGRFIVSKFGQNPDIDTGSVPEDVWFGGGEYTGFPTGSAETVDIFSADASDTSAGVGARTVRIFGLDANGDYQTEDLTMNGTTAVTSSNTWTRVNTAFVITAGTSETNVGNLTIRHTTTTANVFVVIEAGVGRTQLCCYTVPAGHTAYLRRYNVRMTDNNANDARFAFWVRPNGGAVQLQRLDKVSTVDRISENLYGGPAFTELTDIAMRVTYVKNNNGEVSGDFALLVVRNDA